jgi:hypothetical protein
MIIGLYLVSPSVLRILMVIFRRFSSQALKSEKI